ncbi:hypothetical protein A3D62_02815 [Candidatus Kaiserbacteria bacterium RIFCSPHIGHO2_02_FULL_49_11]|uniref:Uncharacterized protein n=1 Tax=Candidatus Kaiserbacteria bacterium RIFCSPHIGHO2_02_FULL_49_11 TaxID=1798489 RepID=A0A1F6D1A7_9BACT|nr:MAG: hypothetical protein A3D62_02815 [Candidatus Kaiserbacteria bacterium RIFCSPHIGHO2_02_FULL_49_11]
MVKLLNKKWKWAVAVILLLLAGYLLYVYFFYVCCAPSPKSALVISNEQNNNPILDDPDLLYAERAFIGLCRTKSGDGGSCHFNTYLYKSGKLVIDSGELAMAPDGEKTTTYPTTQKELDKNLMDRIIKQIQDSGIMNKPCEAEMITDYYINYFINLDGVKKEVQFPGCESEFKEISKLIDTAAE